MPVTVLSICKYFEIRRSLLFHRYKFRGGDEGESEGYVLRSLTPKALRTVFSNRVNRRCYVGGMTNQINARQRGLANPN